MVRWLLPAALLAALPVADLFAAELTGTLRQIQQAGKNRSKEVLRIYDALEKSCEIEITGKMRYSVHKGSETFRVTAA